MSETPNNPDASNVVPMDGTQQKQNYIPSADAMPDNPNLHDPYSLIPIEKMGIPSPISTPKPEQPKEEKKRHPSAG